MSKGDAAGAAARNWSPKWYLWDGGFLALGKSEGVVPMHEHHAIQIVIGVDGDLAVCGKDGVWHSGRGFIVRADAPHSFNGQGAVGAMLFVDPESSEGLWLRSSLSSDITMVPLARLGGCTDRLRTFIEQPLEGMEIGALIRHCVQALCAGAPPARRLDPRVTQVLKAIRDSDDLRISLETAAAMAYLSPSRFAHLFKQQVGLPFRHYILWRKLTRAVLAIAKEGTMAAAAQAADFSDAAHLTRTFYQMFGLPPSIIMRGEFFEIAPPFDLVGD
jgi:AraC family transcriptional regulator